MGWIIAASLTGIFVRQQAAPFVAATNTESLLALNEFIKTGDVTPVVDRTYPLGETAGAFAYLDEGHAHGKVVITI
jgi:NADPH:quinone reductase-like Zn-dependent oxidoreductase